MSDTIKHECGIAFVRLLKPLDFYLKKYGTSVLRTEQNADPDGEAAQPGTGRSRTGQHQALSPNPDCVYINRIRSNDATPIKEIFQRIYDADRTDAVAEEPVEGSMIAAWLKEHVGFTGEVFLGHLRYGTFGKNDIENVHPVSRENNWMTRSLVLAGNFNLTNIDELLRTADRPGTVPARENRHRDDPRAHRPFPRPRK